MKGESFRFAALEQQFDGHIVFPTATAIPIQRRNGTDHFVMLRLNRNHQRLVLPGGCIDGVWSRNSAGRFICEPETPLDTVMREITKEEAVVRSPEGSALPPEWVVPLGAQFDLLRDRRKLIDNGSSFVQRLKQIADIKSHTDLIFGGVDHVYLVRLAEGRLCTEDEAEVASHHLLSRTELENLLNVDGTCEIGRGHDRYLRYILQGERLLENLPEGMSVNF